MSVVDKIVDLQERAEAEKKKRVAQREAELAEMDAAVARFREALTNLGKRAVEDALGSHVTLRALGRLRDTDEAAVEALKMSAKRADVSETDLRGFFKAAKQKWTKWKKANPTETPSHKTLSCPFIDVSRQFREVYKQATRALLDENKPPVVFLRGREVSRIVATSTGYEIAGHTNASLTAHFAQIRDWGAPRTVKTDEGEVEVLKPTDPPFRVVDATLAVPPPNLPVLDRISTIPFFLADGTLVATSGYCEQERTFLKLDPALSSTLSMTPVPERPNDADVSASVGILEDMVVDFPFVEAADKHHYFALLMEPFLGALIGPKKPLHVLEAPAAGSGKSLLGDCAAVIATGQPMAWRPFPFQEEEREKSILTTLRYGAAFVAFDNVKGAVESPTVEGTLTSSLFRGRLLGTNREETVENRASWVMSANNAAFSVDLARRAVRSRLDARIEDPTSRSEFKHPNLLEWVTAERGRLVRAILVLVKNWLARGRPPLAEKGLASFEAWSRVCGGVLEAAGLKGFLTESTRTLVADPRKEEELAFLEAWFGKHGDGEKTAKELLESVVAPHQNHIDGAPSVVVHLPAVLAGHQGQRSLKLGKWLKANLGRVIGGYRIEAGKVDASQKVNRFKVTTPSPGGKAGKSEDQPAVGSEAGAGVGAGPAMKKGDPLNV